MMDERLKNVKVGDVLKTKNSTRVIVREVCDDYVVGVFEHGLSSQMRSLYEFSLDCFDLSESPKAVQGATYQSTGGGYYYGLTNGNVGRFGAEYDFDPAVHTRVS